MYILKYSKIQYSAHVRKQMYSFGNYHFQFQIATYLILTS